MACGFAFADNTADGGLGRAQDLGHVRLVVAFVEETIDSLDGQVQGFAHGGFSRWGVYQSFRENDKRSNPEEQDMDQCLSG